MINVTLERDLEHSLCLYPELIDDSLWGIRRGMEVLGPDYPTLRRQDRMPNGRAADMVFVEKTRITVVEIKKGALSVRQESGPGEDVVDQISDYLRQSRIKYPGRITYRGILVGTAIPDPERLSLRISACLDNIQPLVFGVNIPMIIKVCRCGRALDYYAPRCRCGTRFG